MYNNMMDTTQNNPLMMNTGYEQQQFQQPPAYGAFGQEGVNMGFPDASQYQPQAVPVAGNFVQEVSSTPMQCMCTNCQQFIVTRVETKNGWLPWLICGILILLGCWLGCCLIPFCIDDLKSTVHYCPNCGTMLGEKTPM